jgi:hypothetical protein
MKLFLKFNDSTDYITTDKTTDFYTNDLVDSNINTNITSVPRSAYRVSVLMIINRKILSTVISYN